MTNVLVERLKSKVEGAISKYMNAISTRPTKATYVFGQRTSTVSDARRQYTQQMRSFLELAKQLHATEVESMILGMFNEDDEDEQFLKAEAKK